MKDRDKLKIYDTLRDMHRALLTTYKFAVDCDESDMNAIDAVDKVLYLAEGYFARMSD